MMTMFPHLYDDDEDDDLVFIDDIALALTC